MFSRIANEEIAVKTLYDTLYVIPKETSLRKVVQCERRKLIPKAPSTTKEFYLAGGWFRSTYSKNCIINENITEHEKNQSLQHLKTSLILLLVKLSMVTVQPMLQHLFHTAV